MKDGEDLLLAVWERKRGVAKRLIAAKANIHYTNSFGWTPLHCAADRGLLEVTNVLIDYNADVNARDLNESTPLVAAARANCLATARALLARGAMLEMNDEWGDDAIRIATNQGHTKMAAQLKSAQKGPLARLKGVNVAFSFPPSLYEQVKRLVDEVRRAADGGEGVFGLHSQPRLAVQAKAKDEAADKDDEAALSEEEVGSPTKVTWAGPEVSWCNSCARANLVVQVAPESEEYQQNEVCKEQVVLITGKAKIEALRFTLKTAHIPTKDDEGGDSEGVEALRGEVKELDAGASRLLRRLRNLDNRILNDSTYLQRLAVKGGPTEEEREEEIAKFVSDIERLGAHVDELLERVHEVLKHARHARLEEDIQMIEGQLEKLKAKIRERPKEPEKGANSEEQDKYKREDAAVLDNNKKVNEAIARAEKSLEQTRARLKDDLRTLEKSSNVPPFLVNVSARQLSKMDVRTFTLWLNWQPESNGKK